MTRTRAEDLENGAVSRRTIRRGAVGRDELDERLRPGGAWWQGAIGRGMIGPGGVIPGNIAPGAVQAPDLDDASVTAPKIRDGSVEGPKIADGAVTGPKVPAGALGARELADGSLTLPKFQVGQRPVRIVETVPTDLSDFIVGDAIVNTTDGKVYRLTSDGHRWPTSGSAQWPASGSAQWPTATWDAKVDTVDLRGLLAEGNFGDDLIVARMVAADQIGANELAAIRVEVDKWIRSFNWSPGSAGWAIDGDGNAEFNDVTIRGGAFVGGTLQTSALKSADYVAGSSGWALDPSGNTELNDVTIRGSVLVGGTITAVDLKSSNYQAGSSGWALDGSGNAELNDATFRGNIRASSVTSGQLVSSSYTAGVTGWALDSNGNAEFEDITIRGGQSVGADLYSSSFSSGSSGWAILADGTAEFNDVTVRNSTVTGGVVSGATFETSGTRGIRIDGAGQEVEFGWIGSPDGTIGAVADFRLEIAASSAVLFRTSVGEVMRVTEFGTVNPPVSGVYHMGTTTYRWDTVACVTLNESSDVRGKTIEGRSPGLDLIGALDPVVYHHKGVNQHEPPGKSRLGLTAQQVASVLPPDTHEVVSVGEDGVPSGIAYTQLVAPLVASVQELAARVDALEAA